MNNLRPSAREADIFPGLETPVLSVSKPTDNGYIAISLPDKEGVVVYNKHDMEIIASGKHVL